MSTRQNYILRFTFHLLPFTIPESDFFSIMQNLSVLRYGTMKLWVFLLLVLIGLWSLIEEAHAQPMDDSLATTEQSCSFGMAKGEATQNCRVPFPTG